MLLALDTSTRSIGLALYDGVQVLSEAVWLSQDHHTVELAPAVADMMDKTGVQVSSLQALAVALGPGSFTGLRIGLAFAKGLALVRCLPMIGIPSLDILALAQPVRPIPMAAVLQAGRGRLAVGWYQIEENAWQSEKTLEVLNIDELSQKIQSPTWVCGELNEEQRHVLTRKHKNVLLATPAQALRRPAYLAELGWRRWQAGNVDDPTTLAPIYLHYNQSIPG